MWLTPILPDLCISVYTYTTHPPVAHARPYARQTHMQAQTCVMRVGERILRKTIHQFNNNANKNNDLSNVNNCYAISCQCLHCIM